MQAAGIRGQQASPKGLRHAFGVAAVQAGLPLNMLQKGLGHAHIGTTAIYANAVVAEEREIAARMWLAARTGRPDTMGGTKAFEATAYHEAGHTVVIWLCDHTLRRHELETAGD